MKAFTICALFLLQLDSALAATVFYNDRAAFDAATINPQIIAFENVASQEVCAIQISPVAPPVVPPCTLWHDGIYFVSTRGNTMSNGFTHPRLELEQANISFPDSRSIGVPNPAPAANNDFYFEPAGHTRFVGFDIFTGAVGSSVTAVVTDIIGNVFQQTFAITYPGGFLGVTTDQYIRRVSVYGAQPFLDNIAIHNILHFTMDVQPGNPNNCFKIAEKGSVPVAILGSADFDVGRIDPATLSFGGLEVRVRSKRGPVCKATKLPGDQFTDLLCRFEDDPENWVPGRSPVATLVGELRDGTEIQGTDSICVLAR